MKKIALLFIVLFSLSAKGHAQFSIQDVRFGFQVSPVLSWMNTNDRKINRNGTNLGIKIGTIAEYPIADNYALTGGLGFAFNHGGTIRHDLGGKLLPDSDLDIQIDTLAANHLPGRVDIHYKLQYLEIPFGFKLYTNPGGSLRYYVHFPQFVLGFRTAAFADILGGSGAQSVDIEKQDVKKDVGFLSISYSIGAGAVMEIGSTSEFLFGLQYQRSFTDITADDGRKSNGDQEDAKAYFGTLVFKAGMLF